MLIIILKMHGRIEDFHHLDHRTGLLVSLLSVLYGLEIVNHLLHVPSIFRNVEGHSLGIVEQSASIIELENMFKQLFGYVFSNPSIDEKELAEHNMLVDLGRNDLGKISKFGTVEVEKLRSIERYSHVMHIGSTVRGEIREDCDALDAVSAVLPAGTLSGAPKIRACQLIGELENNKRGIYGGAIGYIDFTGNLDVCIAIRIAYRKNGKVFIRSGAGIVADSVPENEYQECINKAAAVVNALKIAEEADL